MSGDETSLGATIRAWRDRLTPADAGLPAGRARRAAGLRREELAELAGVSVDYVVRLEQGRGPGDTDLTGLTSSGTPGLGDVQKEVALAPIAGAPFAGKSDRTSSAPQG